MTTEIQSTPQAERSHRKELVGIVTSAKMQKTIVVRVTRKVQHSLYDRYVRVSKKFYAHDEKGEAKSGDRVRIQETRPLSKIKRWRLVEVIERKIEPAPVVT